MRKIGNKRRRGQHFKKRDNGCLIFGIMCLVLILILVGCIFAACLKFGTRSYKAESETEQTSEVQVTSETETIPSEEEKNKEVSETENIEAEKENTEERALEILNSMTVEEKVNQLFFITPEALTGVGTVVNAGEATKSALSSHPVGGIIYFSQNFESESQTKTMLENMKSFGNEVCKVPLFLAVDEEGGTVARLGNNQNLNVASVPDMSEIGSRGSLDEAYNTGQVIGAYLAEYGFNVDFAPVADVITNSENTVVKDRSFGSDPQLVSDMAKELSDGLNCMGILSCYKHFPGHGATRDDTHEGFAYTNKTLAEIMNSELLPFVKAAENNADFIMVGHISLPNIIGDNTPASLSKYMITDILKEQLGYKGIIITDSLSMGALTEYYGTANIAYKAFEAGADMLLMPGDFNTAYNEILEDVKSGLISEERLNESVLKIISLKLTME